MTGRFVIICISRRRGESSLRSYLQAFPHMMSHSLFYLFFVEGRKKKMCAYFVNEFKPDFWRYKTLRF